MVKELKAQAGQQQPLAPCIITRRVRQQPLIGQRQQAVGKMQAFIKIEFKRCQNGFTRLENFGQAGGPGQGRCGHTGCRGFGHGSERLG